MQVAIDQTCDVAHGVEKRSFEGLFVFLAQRTFRRSSVLENGGYLPEPESIVNIAANVTKNAQSRKEKPHNHRPHCSNFNTENRVFPKKKFPFCCGSMAANFVLLSLFY